MPSKTKTVFMVAITHDDDGIPGANAAAAIYQGWGASYTKAYLESKLPAGSPYTIGQVIQVASEVQEIVG